MTTETSRNPTTLWVGGSSGLARTYINKYGSTGLLLTGLEYSAPSWADGVDYIRLDLTTLTENVVRKITRQYPTITKIIIGVRPLLFTAYTKAKLSDQMLEGIKTLLRVLLQVRQVELVLHISSVAAVDHLRSQSYVSEDDPIPPLTELKAPYDIFKRECEEEISVLCQDSKTAACHLRLSAIFSDDKKCIQCSALQLQSRVGPYLPLAIDCNSSANVASAIRVILQKEHQQIDSVYYYTRPLSLEQPVPYGYYLETYRQANAMENVSIWIPSWIFTCFVALVHWIATWNTIFRLPYLDAADYLLQVASREHSFNCDKFGNNFPDLEEESILECFIRRKTHLETEDKRRNGTQPNTASKKKK